jgi:hypothetical protein
MRVVFSCSDPEFFDYMLDAFKLAKKNDNWHLATLKIGRKKVKYITCCKNVYLEKAIRKMEKIEAVSRGGST